MFISFLVMLFVISLISFIISLLQTFKHRKSYGGHNIPSNTRSPPSYPIIGCFPSFYQNRRRLLTWYTELLSSSPTQSTVIKRLGARRIIVTANPDNIQYVLKTNFPNYPKGKPFTDILGDLLGRGIFNVDGEQWFAQRKLASHEFTAKSLRDFLVKTLEEVVDNRLIPLLEEAATKGQVLDLQEVLRRLAFDAVCKVSLGTDPFCLDVSNPVPDLVRAFDEASELCALRGAAPLYLVWKVSRVLNLGKERRLKEAVKVVHGRVLEIVRSKKRDIELGGAKGNDLLSRLLLAGEEEELIRDMVISFIMAGRDTTSSGLTWLFWLLSKHRDVEKSIVDEVAETTFGAGRRMGFDELKKMGFLKACLCESMRLYPPVAWDSKHAKNDDVLPDGTFVGKGDRVTYFPYGMGRMESLWGKDRLEFKPDRWFVDPARCSGGLRSVSPYVFPVFQAGPRVCLGKEMAFLQMKYVVASVLRRFEVRPVGNQDQPVFVPLLTAHMAGGLKVRIKRKEEYKFIE